MEESQRTSPDKCPETRNNQTGTTMSSGFIGAMSAVLVLDFLVVVGDKPGSELEM